MQELASSLGLAGVATWAGTLRGQDKADAFDAADLFVLPSENENFGITVAEALLAGVPALLSDQVDLHEVVTKHQLGAVCRPDVESCTKHLLDLLKEPRRLAESADRSQRVATSLFSPEMVGLRLRDLYLSVLAQP